MTRQNNSTTEKVYHFGEFRFYPGRQWLVQGDVPVTAGCRALEVLEVLLRHPGRLISKEVLLDQVWPDTIVSESCLKVHVAALRKALGDSVREYRYIETVYRKGYRFVAPVTPGPRPPAASTAIAAIAAVRAAAPAPPVARKQLIGRADSLKALRDALRKRRLLTITGPAGIGKSAIARVLAQSVMHDEGSNVHLADLHTVGTPQQLKAKIAESLGLKLQAGDFLAGLLASTRGISGLLVLDNCDRVVDATSALAADLLALVPGMRLIVTSRESLGVQGEAVHRLGPLALPHEGDTANRDTAAMAPALQLLIQQAGQGGGYGYSEQDTPLLAHICRQLDGVPLAIELAGRELAHLGHLGIQGMQASAGAHPLTLGSNQSCPDHRHRSMRAALDWNMDRLGKEERRLLCALCTFDGSFTLEMAIATLSEDAFSACDVVEGIVHLVARSLLEADVSGTSARYRLLRTTKAHVLQKQVQIHASAYCKRQRCNDEGSHQ